MENIAEEPALKYNYLSAEEYLETERVATEKHEYYQGSAFAMSGASLKYINIFSNLFIDIGDRLTGKVCRRFDSDTRMNISKKLYPFIQVSPSFCKP